MPSSRHGDDGGLGGGVRHGDDGGRGGADGDRGVEHHAGGLGLGHIATGDAESGQLSSAQSGDQLTKPTKQKGTFFGRDISDIPLFSPSLERKAFWSPLIQDFSILGGCLVGG